MYCHQCGAENSDDAKFCSDCGALLQSGNQNEGVSADQGNGAGAATPTVSSYVNPESSYESIPQNPPYGSSATDSYAAQNNVYAQGCLGAAWEDITSTDGWFGKTALLGLVNIVPILNWFVQGYAMRWARQLVFDRVNPMPEKIFDNRNFINGAFQFVLSVCMAIVTFIVCSILGIVPLIGGLASIVVGFAASMFLNVAVMRAAVADNLGAGFGVKDEWEIFKRKPAQLFCASWIASIVVNIVIVVVALVLGLIFGALEGVNYLTIYETAAVSPLYLATFVGIIGGYLLVVYVVASILSAFSIVLSLRACGHYVARYAPEWTRDPEILATAHIYDN
jgi:hypothetical protein